jgi:ABC-type iron transport system FetAB permease component
MMYMHIFFYNVYKKNTIMAILKLIVMNFIVGYLWHISMTMVFLLVTVYVTGSSRFKSEKIQQYVTKMGIQQLTHFLTISHI